MNINTTTLTNALAVVGVCTLGYTGLQTLSNLRFHLHSSKLQRYKHGSESWALVTGASDGIGLAFVNELANRGFNVILHGRNEEKMKKVLAETQAKHPTTKFKLLVLNSTTPAGPEFDQTVLSAVKGVHLTVVIHNVAGSGKPTMSMPLFDDFSASDIDGWIDVNVRFQTHMTRLLLPILTQNKPALMIYISSAVTVTTAPWVSLYTAAKQYIEGLARCIKLEMKMNKTDVEVMSLTVGMVATASSGRREEDANFTMPTTRDFVNSALAKVGWGEAKVTPYFGHGVMFSLVTSLPVWLQDSMMISMSRKAQEQIAEAQEKRK